MKKFLVALFAVVALAIPASSSAYLDGQGGGMPACNDGDIGATYSDGVHTWRCTFYTNAAGWDRWVQIS